jgi:hypothetical protein
MKGAKMADVASVQLPLWIEYTKALGAPIMALIAACIAGGIAYQQWITARNKLKLDLFDKRMKIYDACSELLRCINMPIRTDYDEVMQLVYTTNGHHWLFGSEVTVYIDALLERSEEIAKKQPLAADGLDDNQKFALALGFFENTKENYLKDVKSLDAIFAPYMRLKH